MAVTPEVVTVSLIGEPSSGASRALLAALESTLERNGAVHGESEDANFVLNVVDPEDPKPFRRKSRGTFVAAIYERDAMPTQIEDSLKLEYPMLVRALANIVLCYVPGPGRLVHDDGARPLPRPGERRRRRARAAGRRAAAAARDARGS